MLYICHYPQLYTCSNNATLFETFVFCKHQKCIGMQTFVLQVRNQYSKVQNKIFEQNIQFITEERTKTEFQK